MTKILGIAGAMVLTASAAMAADEAARPAATIPVEAFAELPRFDQPVLSPDGTRIAAKMALNKRQVLVVFPLTGDAKPRTLAGGGSTDINWWRWVGDGWLAIGAGAKDVLYGEEIYVTRTLGMNVADGKTTHVDWENSGIRADDVLWTAHDGTPRILLSRQTGVQELQQFYPEVVEANLATGRVRRVVSGRTNVFNWYADGRGQVRMGYRYDDDARESTLYYRANNAEDFRPIARRKRAAGEAIPIPLIFRADATAVATSQTSGHDAVYEVSLPALTLGRKLFDVADYDVDALVSNLADDTLDGVVVTEKFGRTIWLDPAMKDLQAKIDASVGNRRARIVSWNDARTRFLIEVGSPAQAGALYYFDTAAGAMSHLAWNNDTLKGRTLSPVKTIRYAARDGTAIEAVLTLPRHRAAKDLPLIVMPHGGPFARDAEGWDWWTQFLAESGYAVIQPNYRGSSGYGRAFEQKGEGQWGLAMQDDLDDAIAWAAKEGIADRKRVCMIGASYGGYAAMRAAQRDGDKYRCAVSYAGVSDLEAMRRYDSQFLNGKTRSDWLRKQAPDFRAISPRFGAAQFGAPILIVHGREDKRVPVKQSRMLADALKSAGKPYEYVEQPLGDHHFSRTEDRLDFFTRMKTFLDKHNPS